MESLQLWAEGGRSVTVEGDGPNLLVRFKDDTNLRNPTDDERRAVEVERLAVRLWERECYCCDSSLVTDMMQAASSGDLGRDLAKEWDFDQCVNLTTTPDGWDYDQCVEWLTERDEEPAERPYVAVPYALKAEEGEDLDGATETAYLLFDTERDWTDAEALRKAVEEETGEDVATVDVAGIDVASLVTEDGSDWDEDDATDTLRDQIRDNAETAEVYEWWRVSKWFADKLAEAGEVVLDNAYGYWWGRTCTGQPVMMDGTIQKVAAGMID